MDKKAQIQELISLGKTEEALELLEQLNSDAVLLQSRYNGAKRQYSMGMIDFSDWSRVQAQINYAALEMMNAVKSSAPAFKPSAPKNSKEINDKPEVYLAYNLKDKFIAQLIMTFLKKNDISIIDYLQINVGQSITDFVINKALKSEFILVLVSENSLRGGWIGMERYLDVFSNSLIQRNVIPIALDTSYSDANFIKNEITRIEEELDKLDLTILKNPKSKILVENLESEKADLTVYYNNLPKIVQRLRNVSVIEISKDHFKSGMDKVLHRIRKNTERIASVAS